jgi:hypothetical protein
MKTLVLSALFGAVALAASAVNLSGKWAIQATGRGGPTILVLNQVGDEVAGNITAALGGSSGSPVSTEIIDGKVEGSTITFYVWQGRDQMAKVMYKGLMSGEEIAFTVTGGPPSYNFRGERNTPPEPVKVTAKRAK